MLLHKVISFLLLSKLLELDENMKYRIHLLEACSKFKNFTHLI